MQTAINFFLVYIISGHINALTNITFSYKKGTVTFVVYQQTFTQSNEIEFHEFVEKLLFNQFSVSVLQIYIYI